MNARDMDTIRQGLTEDCRYEANGSPLWPLVGREEVVGRFQALLTAFPNQVAEISSLVSDGDQAAAEIHIVETHTGHFSTPFGVIPPTGHEIDEIVAYVIAVDDAGQVTRIGH